MTCQGVSWDVGLSPRPAECKPGAFLQDPSFQSLSAEHGAAFAFMGATRDCGNGTAFVCLPDE